LHTLKLRAHHHRGVGRLDNLAASGGGGFFPAKIILGGTPLKREIDSGKLDLQEKIVTPMKGDREYKGRALVKLIFTK